MSFARLPSLRRLFDVGRIIAVQATFRRANHTIDLSDSVVQQYMRHLVDEFKELRSRTQLGRVERARLLEISPIVNVLDERILLHESIDSLKELNRQESKDEDLRKQIAEEATLYLSRLKEIDGELLAALLETPLAEGGALVEVSAGAGGQEAMLFAGELLQMYEGYAQHRGWQLDVASLERSELGGVRRGSLLVAGVGARELMLLEAGVHRVQRTPSTERAGRVHTSTATVAVLPQPTHLELELSERDLRVETKRASGAGGQHVNTTDSAVRLTHLPTGTTVECQEDRSQIKNKQLAMQKLRALLLQRSRDRLASEIHAQRKSQVGSGERNEKIRTYNFPQDRVTEHGAAGEATGSVHDLRGFLAGGEPLARVHDAALRRLRYRHLVDEIERLGRAAPAVAADR